VTGLVATVASRISGASRPGWAAAPPQDLTPASGRQDHTTSPYATTSFVSAPFDRSQILVRPALHHVSRLTLPRPPHPHPASVTIAIRPSVGRDGESSRIDLGQMGTEIFFGKSEIRQDSTQLESKDRVAPVYPNRSTDASQSRRRLRRARPETFVVGDRPNGALFPWALTTGGHIRTSPGSIMWWGRE